MSKLTLYGLNSSVYTQIALLVLEEKGVDYTFEKVDIFNKSKPPSSYLQRNPFARIPMLSEGDLNVYETTAITRYIDEAYSGPSLQPQDIELRAKMNQCISLLDAYAYRSMIWPIFVERVSIPQSGGKPNETAIAEALPVAKIVVSELERMLGDQAYLAGPELTLADLHAVPMLMYFYQTQEGLSLLSTTDRLYQWFKKIQGRSTVSTLSSLKN